MHKVSHSRWNLYSNGFIRADRRYVLSSVKNIVNRKVRNIFDLKKKKIFRLRKRKANVPGDWWNDKSKTRSIRGRDAAPPWLDVPRTHAARSPALCIIPGRITMTMTAITIEPDRIGEGASRQLGKLLTNNAATGGETAIRRGVVSSCEPQCSKSSRAGVHPFAHNRPWDTPSSAKNRYDFYRSSVHMYIYALSEFWFR